MSINHFACPKCRKPLQIITVMGGKRRLGCPACVLPPSLPARSAQTAARKPVDETATAAAPPKSVASAAPFFELLRAWIKGLAATFLWIWAVTPTAEAGSSALWVAIASFIATSALLWDRFRLARAHQGKVPTSQAVTKDLVIAFAIMTTTASAFMLLNHQLKVLAGSDEAAVTLRRIARVQSEIDSRRAWMTSAHVTLWVAAAVFAIGLILHGLGRSKAFRTLFDTHKRVKKVIRNAMLTGLCLGSFSLAGSAATASLIATDQQAIYDFTAALHDAQADLSNRITQQLLQAATQEILEDRHDRPDCRSPGNADTDPCSDDPLPGLVMVRNDAATLHADWPPHPADFALPSDPVTSARFTTVSADLSEIAAWPSSTRPASAVSDVLPLAATKAAAAALPDADPEQVAKRQRLSDLIGLAISTVLDAKGISFKAAIGKPYGDFVAQLSNTVAGAAQSRLEDAGRDISVGMVLACRKSPAACHDEVARRLKALRTDPRVTRIAAQLGKPARAMAARYRTDGEGLLALTTLAQTHYARAIDVIEAGESRGVWGDMRERWSSDVANDRIEGLTPDESVGWSRFFRDWHGKRGEMARTMLYKGYGADHWDSVFLEWIADRPERAAIWGYVVLNDSSGKAEIRASLPDSGTPISIDVGDAFLIYASKIRRTPWSRGIQIPETAIPYSSAFKDAVWEYCPHRMGASLAEHPRPPAQPYRDRAVDRARVKPML